MTHALLQVVLATSCGDKGDEAEPGDPDYTPESLSCPAGPGAVTWETWLGDIRYEFMVTNFSWQTPPVFPRFSVNETSFGEYCDGVDEDDISSSFTMGSRPWNFDTSLYLIEHLPDIDVTGITAREWDGTSAVRCDAGGDPTYRGAVASATMWYNKKDPTCGAVECDITVYHSWTGADYPFADESVVLYWWPDMVAMMSAGVTGEGSTANQVPLDLVLTHELGHCLGMEHNIISNSSMCDADYCDPRWFYGLADVDREAARFLY